MRGLTRLATTSNCPTTTFFAAKQSLLSSSHSYSTFSGGSGGGGRGRGRGSSPPRFPGQTEPNAEEDAFNPPPGLGHGRGQPVLPSSPVLPSFSSFISSPNPSSSAAAGRGRGRLSPSPATEIPDSSNPKKPIFFRREDSESGSKKTQFADPDESPSLSPPLPSISGAGRGKPVRPSPDSGAKPPEINRHLRPRTPIGSTTSAPTGAPPGPKLGREEAIKKAVEVLSRGGGGRGRGRGVMGRGRGRGRGRRGRGRDTGEEFDLYLGDNADGEKLEKRLGEENMKKLTEGFEELSWTVLPSPVEDAYLDALHTNNMIEYEPEYLMEFDTNPDIDEKPPMSLEDALEKAKPFLMAYEGIQSQEEWEEIIKETMEKVPYMKELMDMYCGPDRVTAKQQQQELERVAKTLPENIPSSVKRFTDRAVLSLQSNPGWGWDKKCQFMDKLVWEVSQHYK